MSNGNSTMVIGPSALEPFDLKTEYYLEACILLGLPIVVTSFFVLVFIVFIVVVFLDYRRNQRFRNNQRFEDEEMPDEQDMEAFREEIVQTYMQLLEVVRYGGEQGAETADGKDDECKYNECVICYKEFEKGESLRRIPNCQHVFHE